MLGLPRPVLAASIDTQTVIQLQERTARLDRFEAFLAREDVADALVQLGVTPQDARERIGALTDEELKMLENQERVLLGRGGFDQYRKEALQISKRMDDWIKNLKHSFAVKKDDHLSVLFLGGCAGEWAARSRYRGNLPPFGGFLIAVGEKLILVDPGRSTFKNLINLGIAHSHLELASRHVDHDHAISGTGLGVTQFR